ncbi:OsmC family protein [soil metagenome]
MPVRQFELLADEPPKSGGTDTGPMPTELLLCSLASCFAMAVAYAAGERDLQLRDLLVHVDGEYDGARFGSLRVEVQSSHAREELEDLVRAAKRYCYISNTLARSPELEYTVAQPPAGSPPAPHA